MFFEFDNGSQGFNASQVTSWWIEGDGDFHVRLVDDQNLVTMSAAAFAEFRRYVQPINLETEK